MLTKLKEPSKGFVKIARDMTQHKIQEEQKDEFIAIASHELRTPVTSIKSYTELLLENMKADDNDENVRMVNKLNAQVDKLTDLVRALLDTTKITGKQMVLNKEAFDINEMIRNCVETFQRMTRKHRLILDQTKVPHLYADPEGINQVLNNIVSNAIKYSPSGGDIVVSTRLGGDNILIAVQDSGIGIPLDHQKLLFERFYRSPGQDKNTYPGLGLGMYISNEIVKRHGGNIRVESKEGEGSTFTVILPLVNTEDGQKENSQM